MFLPQPGRSPPAGTSGRGNTSLSTDQKAGNFVSEWPTRETLGEDSGKVTDPPEPSNSPSSEEEVCTGAELRVRASEHRELKQPTGRSRKAWPTGGYPAGRAGAPGTAATANFAATGKGPFDPPEAGRNPRKTPKPCSSEGRDKA